ncbi:MAG: OPT/YSL family transporter [Phycisphaerae bacterium]|nr:OPT/YSL family transporter [Phycisphaerae bacterium]
MKEQGKDKGKATVRRGPYPELTVTSVVVGYAIGIVIAVSIGYACLILGFSIEGSELAAILGFGILRGLLGRHSMVENNINQTIASAVNGASSGMMFTVPALYILQHPDFSPVLMVFACIAGGILGIAFIIPLRKQMIDFERLTYPGGVAVATILKSPGAGMHKAMLMVVGIMLSGGLHFASQCFGFEYWDLGRVIHMPEYMNGIWFVSLMTIGVGFIAGKGGLSFIVGGYVCWWILAPLLNGMGELPGPEVWSAIPDMTLTKYMRVEMFRPVGIGMLIGGAITGIVLALPLMVSAINAMRTASKMKTAHSRDEMPIHLLYVGIVGAAVLLFIVAVMSTEAMGWGRGLIMALVGTLWVWIAGVILSECIGRTNWSPLSGMTLIAVTILVIISSGLGTSAAIISSIMVGAAACVAMSQATDLMMDLKTGYLVGATPRKQQIGQFLAVWLGPIVVMGLIYVLNKAYGLGGDKLPAPQGQALAATIEGILGGDVPLNKYIAGAGLGALLSSSGVGGLGILVGLGFYLPFDVVLTYSIGTVLRLAVDRVKGNEFSEDVGIPVAAGFIVGEALVGVGFAMYFVFKGAVS